MQISLSTCIIITCSFLAFLAELMLSELFIFRDCQSLYQYSFYFNFNFTMLGFSMSLLDSISYFNCLAGISKASFTFFLVFAET